LGQVAQQVLQVLAQTVRTAQLHHLVLYLQLVAVAVHTVAQHLAEALAAVLGLQVQ
jgi:hypothetical protein